MTPNVRYYTAMDMVLLLTEDVSYRARPYNRYVELLLHPEEERIVGIKVLHAKKVHALFDLSIEAPLTFLAFVLAAVVEDTFNKPPFLTPEIWAFLRQHVQLTLTPAERERINFTLVP